MSTRRAGRGLLGLATFAAGVAAGVAAEELLYRRVFGRPDPENEERFGSVHGHPRWIESFDGTRLYAQTFGPEDAPAIVFLHGFSLNHAVWHYQLKDLASSGLRLVAFDARGHGRSDPVGQRRLDPETLARDLHAVVSATAAVPSIVVGHSMGGMTLQALLEFADTYDWELGAIVRGLVLVNTTFTAELGAWRGHRPRSGRVRGRLLGLTERLVATPERVERLRLPVSDLAMLTTRLGFGARPSPSHVALTRRMMETTPTETVAAGVLGLAAFDAHARLEKIDVPTLIVAGDRDILCPVWLSREMADRIPDAELVVLSGVGHMAMLERHEAFTAELRKFAERVFGS